MSLNTSHPVLNDLRFLGLDFSLTTEGGLQVRPSNLLTEDIRKRVRFHKSELVEALQREAMSVVNEFGYARNASCDRASLVNKRFSEAHSAYINHHWTCHQCCAAGKRLGARCGQGQSLWTQYEESLADKLRVEIKR